MAIFSDYISLKEAAQNSGYHSDYIGALVRSGKIAGKKVGNRWMVSKEEVRIHFSTKHYVPATKVFLSRKVVIFGVLLTTVFLFFFVVFIETENSIPVAAKSSLGEITNSGTAVTVEDAGNPAGNVIIQKP